MGNTKVAHYFRTSKPSAIIYVRGNNEEMQEMICRVYAIDQGFEVLYVTRDIDEVKNCNVLLVTNRSRISRNQEKYYSVVKELKKNGIELISVSSQDNSMESISLVIDLFKESQKK